MINAMNFGVFTPGLYSDPYSFDDIDLMDFKSSTSPMMNSIFAGTPGLGMPMPMLGMGYGYNQQQYYLIFLLNRLKMLLNKIKPLFH